MIEKISKTCPMYIKYKEQRHNAKRRRIPWLFTFPEWRQWWLDTGHWAQRGRGADDYVMSRLGDAGPYAVWNVVCKTFSENVSEAHTGKQHTLGKTWSRRDKKR